jgi:regulator of protease activity HflC (stomatin/prohibitin superfamily)
MPGNIQMDPNNPAEVLIPPYTCPDGTVITAPEANLPIGSPDGLPNTISDDMMLAIYAEEVRRKKILAADAAGLAAAKQALAQAQQAQQQAAATAQAAVDAAQANVNTSSGNYNFDAAVTTQYTAFRQLAQSRYDQQTVTVPDNPTP